MKSADSVGWVVVGLGRAGQARLRAIASRSTARLMGTIGRRPGRGDTTLAAALADPAVDGVIICSENAHHAPTARAALAADKHVVVEFPLAGSASEARALFEQARSQQRVLHTEFLGLLTARHAALRAAVATNPLARYTVRFTGRSYRWVEDEWRAGRVGALAVGRLHQLWDLFGPLTLEQVAFEAGADGYRLQVELACAVGTRVRLDDTRGVGLERGSTLGGVYPDGTPLVIPAPAEPGDLFGRDLDAATRRVRTSNAEGAYVADRVVVEVMALADAISDRARRR